MDELLRGLTVGLVCYGIINIVYNIMTFINTAIEKLKNTPDMTYEELVVFYNQTKDRTNERNKGAI